MEIIARVAQAEWLQQRHKEEGKKQWGASLSSPWFQLWELLCLFRIYLFYFNNKDMVWLVFYHIHIPFILELKKQVEEGAGDLSSGSKLWCP